MKNNALIPYKYPVTEIKYNTPKIDEKCYVRTITQINNAWRNCSFLDDSGHVWVAVDKIHSILRTNKDNGRYFIQLVEESAKKTINNTTYIMGYRLGALIDRFIQETGEGSKSRYLRYSEELYRAIRDSDTAKKLRLEFALELSDSRKGLKKARIKGHKIIRDELTGLKLIKKTCEFSHIRSFAIFPQFGKDVENGLIVNKDIHEVITNAGVNDEEELYDLCDSNNWDISWYDKFKEHFG